MKIKTNELKDQALDWAVAKCEGDKLFRACLGRPDDWNGAAYRAGDTTDERWETRVQVANVAWFADYTYNPSINWSQGGPIIERERPTLSHSPYDHVVYGREQPWCAEKRGRMSYGPTPLIAAMRCYVASVLGTEVEVPNKVTGETE